MSASAPGGSPLLLSRLVLGVVLREPMATAPLEQLLRDEARTALGAVELPDAVARVALPVAGSPAGSPETAYDEVLASGLSNGVLLGGLDAVVELAVPSSHGASRVVTGFAGIGDRLKATVDADASMAVVGTDFVIVDGDAPIQLFYFMRRNPSLTLQGFTETWRDQHTKVARFTPGLAGYRQLHADAALSADAARSAGVGRADVDGVAQEWFDTIDAFLSATGAPAEFREQAKASESRFNDLQKVTAVLTNVGAPLRGGDAV
jgi:hypothetical protein